jgi:16S rRNA (guanine1207-N2)-methyltransferase
MTHRSSVDAFAGSDAYFKKRLTYQVRGQQFVFDVGHTIFSSFQIDDGTDLLLRSLAPSLEAPQHLLDLGCGCGVIGIVLAHHYPEADVVLADKDLLALRYARHNAAINQVERVTVIGSVGVESLPDVPYDMILSNIPAKIGDRAIEEEFVLAPLDLLRSGGEYWFVVVSGLNHLIPRLGVRHQLKLKAIKKRSGHTVYRIIKP